MKKWLKFLLVAGGIGLLAGLALLYWIFNKPHRDVSKEKGIQLTSQQLFEAFRKDEAVANGLYLDKAIELSGTVAEVSTNQVTRSFSKAFAPGIFPMPVLLSMKVF
jgi:hypothetical protein